jgi:hypothetical protein
MLLNLELQITLSPFSAHLHHGKIRKEYVEAEVPEIIEEYVEAEVPEIVGRDCPIRLRV